MDRAISGTPMPSLPGTEAAINPRLLWALNRFRMETENRKSRRYGGKGPHHWYALLFMMRTLEVLLKLTRQYERGVRNAWDIAIRGLEVPLPRLPAAFDGFTILHLSDLHLDGMPGLEEAILDRVGVQEFDLCVLTGDYRTELHGPIRPTMDRLQPLVSRLRSRNGVLAVLGNHDDCHMVGPMEAMGIRVLVNEAVRLTRGEDVLQVVGTDDVHYYFTDQAVHALEAARDAFTVALVHSPEVFDVAADLGVDLYLCGHSHAGQVCLPGGRPVIKHLSRGRRFYRGTWKHRSMVGITNAGVGTSGVPVRFNTRGEILVLTLRCAGAGPRANVAAS
ncbi:MAG TPA: metallophosphoesterase [Vicinamibacteria bacterium]|nr:metallophosphoesterase [Vicinamibacteria bacterium]